MKINIPKIGLVLGLAAILTATLWPAKAQEHHQKASSPAVVIFAAYEYYQNGFPLTYTIYLVSRGPNAPEILPGMELAPVIEKLIAQGFEVQDSGGLRYTAIRK